MRLHALSLQWLLLVSVSLCMCRTPILAEKLEPVPRCEHRWRHGERTATTRVGPKQEHHWKTAVRRGWDGRNPCVWGNKLFVTTAESDQQQKPDPENSGPGFTGLGGFLFSGGLSPPDVNCRWKVLCLNATTGSILWEQVAHEGRPSLQIHANNTYATETPVTDGERLIAYFGMTGVYCYDLAGKLLWSQDLAAYPMQFGWGTAGSPILLDDHVYINVTT